MITLVEALNYRCLRYISRPLQPFHVLVGPNASGKTTFLDVVGLLSTLPRNFGDVLCHVASAGWVVGRRRRTLFRSRRVNFHLKGRAIFS